jgi:hypothetical protein
MKEYTVKITHTDGVVSHINIQDINDAAVERGACTNISYVLLQDSIIQSVETHCVRDTVVMLEVFDSREELVYTALNLSTEYANYIINGWLICPGGDVTMGYWLRNTVVKRVA